MFQDGQNTDQDKRRFPRHNRVGTHKIVRLDPTQTPRKNLVVTKNLSACGAKFSTVENLTLASYLLLCLDDPLIRELNEKNRQWLRTGNSYLSQVIWTTKTDSENYEVGVRFLEKHECDAQILDTFTELSNINMLDIL